MTSPEPPSTEVPPPLAPRRPAWSYFVMPGAILLAALIVGAALWFALRDDSASVAAPAVPDSANSFSAAPAAAAASPSAEATSLVDTFALYARQAGLDEAKFRTCIADPAWTTPVNADLRKGVDLGITGTPTFFINNKMLVGSLPVAVYEEIIDAELKGSPTEVTAYSATVQQLASQGQFKILQSKVDVSGSPVEGNPNAKVMIAEFSDFQCPFCKRFVDQALATIRKREGNDVALAFLHFPIVKLHANAGHASGAAQCAAEQGRFWPMHDLLFKNQAAWQNLR